MTENLRPPAYDNEASEEDTVSLLDLAQVLVDNLRLLVIFPLIVGLIALGLAFLIPPTFTASTRFVPPQQQQSSANVMLQSLGALGGLAGAATGLKNPADQFVAFLKSESVANSLVERFKLQERYEARFKTDARRLLEATSRISSAKDGLITVEVDDKEAAFAAQLANAYVEEFGKVLSRLAVTEAQQRRVFFESQLSKAKDNLVKAEIALQSSGVNSSALKSNPEVAVKALAELQAKIAAQEIKLASMRGYLAEVAPDFKLAQVELSALKRQLAKSEQSSTEKPIADADYIARVRDFKYYETLFDLFAKQYEVAKIDEAREGSLVQILDPATPPERKSKPKKAQITLLAMLVSFILVTLFIFVRQGVRTARLDPSSAKKMHRLKIALGHTVGHS